MCNNIISIDTQIYVLQMNISSSVYLRYDNYLLFAISISFSSLSIWIWNDLQSFGIYNFISYLIWYNLFSLLSLPLSVSLSLFLSFSLSLSFSFPFAHSYWIHQFSLSVYTPLFQSHWIYVSLLITTYELLARDMFLFFAVWHGKRIKSSVILKHLSRRKSELFWSKFVSCPSSSLVFWHNQYVVKMCLMIETVSHVRNVWTMDLFFLKLYNTSVIILNKKYCFCC